MTGCDDHSVDTVNVLLSVLEPAQQRLWGYYPYTPIRATTDSTRAPATQQIIDYLLSMGRFTVREAANELGVTTNTIHHCLRQIRQKREVKIQRIGIRKIYHIC